MAALRTRLAECRAECEALRDTLGSTTQGRDSAMAVADGLREALEESQFLANEAGFKAEEARQQVGPQDGCLMGNMRAEMGT